MKRVVYILIVLFLFIVPSKVKGETYALCNATNLTKLQKIATNISTSYEYIEKFNGDIGDVTFTVKIDNLDERLYLVDDQTGKRYNYSSNELTLYNIAPNRTLKYRVYANDYGCNDKQLIILYINIPPYNRYYKTSICQEFSTNKLCGRWNNVDMSYEELEKTLVKLRKQNTKPIEEEKKVKTFNDYFIDVVMFLNKYRMEIFVPIIALSSLGILLKVILRKKEWKEIK